MQTPRRRCRRRREGGRPAGLRSLWWTAGLVAAGLMAAGLTAGSARAKGPATLAPAPTTAENYGETFTAIADLEGGDYLLLQYLFTNAGFGDRKAACRALYVPRGGSLQTHGVDYSESEWSYQPGAGGLRVGGCRLNQRAGHTVFEVDLPGVVARLDFGSAPRAVSPTPALRGKWGFYEHEVLIPFSPLEASIQPKGQPQRRLRGLGYLDHTRSEAFLPQVASSWIRFRGFYDGTPVLFQVRFTPEGKLGSAWIWRSDQPAPVAVVRVLAAPMPGARGMHLQVSTAWGELHIDTGEQLYLYEPTKAYGLLGALARPLIGNPENRTYRATLRGTPAMPRVRGTLEWTRISH